MITHPPHWRIWNALGELRTPVCRGDVFFCRPRTSSGGPQARIILWAACGNSDIAAGLIGPRLGLKPSPSRRRAW
jgi:hypothetical protein